MKAFNIIYKLLLFFCLAHLLYDSVILSHFIISREHDVRGSETNMIYTIQELDIDNERIYQDVFNQPYAITNYTPFYFVLADTVNEIFCFSKNTDVYGFRMVLRCLSLLIFLIMIFFSFKTISVTRNGSITWDEKIALGVILFLLTFPWYMLTRPDVLVSLFFVLSTLFVLKNHGDGNMKHVYWAGAFSILAVLSKQNGVQILIVTLVSFLLFKKYKEILHYLGSMAFFLILFSLVYVLAGYSTSYLYENLIIGVSSGISYDAQYEFAIEPFFKLFKYPIFTILALFLFSLLGLRRNFKLFFLGAFFTSSLVFAFFSSLKYGSAEHYFNDAIIFSMLFLFSFFKEHSKQLVAICFTYCFFLIGVHYEFYYKFYEDDFLKDYASDISHLNEFLNENMNEDQKFYTNVRPVLLDNHSKAVFPQYDIYYGIIQYSEEHQNEFKEFVYEADLSDVKYLILNRGAKNLIFDSTNFQIDHKTIFFDVLERRE